MSGAEQGCGHVDVSLTDSGEQEGMGEVGLQGAWWAAPGWTFLSSYSGGGRGEEEEDEEKQLVPGAALLNAHAEPVMWHCHYPPYR